MRINIVRKYNGYSSDVKSKTSCLISKGTKYGLCTAIEVKSEYYHYLKTHFFSISKMLL